MTLRRFLGRPEFRDPKMDTCQTEVNIVSLPRPGLLVEVNHLIVESGYAVAETSLALPWVDGVTPAWLRPMCTIHGCRSSVGRDALPVPRDGPCGGQERDSHPQGQRAFHGAPQIQLQ